MDIQSGLAGSLPRIIVIDDDPDICRLLKEYLESNLFSVETGSSKRDLDRYISQRSIDLLILDVRLKEENGMQIARKVRESSRVPILMLTGLSEEADRVMGLELGADDYLTKPFSTRELLARVRALLRRVQLQTSLMDTVNKVRLFKFAGWELVMGLRRLKSPTGDSVEMTNGEFSLLTAFLASPMKVLSRDQLLELSRLHNAEVYDRSIDVQILRLRRKIEVNPSNPSLILTQRGAGYLFNCDVEKIY